MVPIKEFAAEVVTRFQNRWLYDIEGERQRQALVRTAAFVEEKMPSSVQVPGKTARSAKIAILDFALDRLPAAGLVLEFGVASGGTLRQIASRTQRVHGFDSFEGLPEDWRPGFERGHFQPRSLPEVAGAVLHKGWICDTLPGFLDDVPDKFALVHIDVDLYSSTQEIFRLAEDRFTTGTLILFDEYFNYPGWEDHEHRAFSEFVERTGVEFQYLAYNPLHQQVLVRIC